MRRRQPEAQIQEAVIKHLAQFGVKGHVAFHCPNGGWRNVREASRLKRMGVLPGIPDLMIVYKGDVFGLELKAPGGRATEAQLETIARLEAAGAYCCVAEGFDASIGALSAWGLLR